MPALILIRGGGDLASGVALRLYHAGLKVMVSELPQPLAVRRAVSFAEAVYAEQITVEGVTGRLVERRQVWDALDAGEIPVLIDPDAFILTEASIPIVIDARLTKHPPAPLPVTIPLHIGLGPGFHAGQNCQAVIETRRGHTLGRVYWDGMTQPDSGQPEGDPRRVLRAPADGQIIAYAQIGDHLEAGDVVAEIQSRGILSPSASLRINSAKNLLELKRDSSPPMAAKSDKVKVVTPIKGVLRGLIHPGLLVTEGLKIGDVDPRDRREDCFLVSDKALAIGGAALEAILTRQEIREFLW